ncbi:MAG: replication initiation protein, partial [Campylobacterota bacterium]|nr:replication initiation protein [Campylobacterota bacterium]
MKKIKVIENMAKKEIINKDYQLINARYKLSVVQTKIILKTLSLINNKEDTEFLVYQLPMSFFNFLSDHKNHKRIREECKVLRRKELSIETTDEGWIEAGWFSSFEYKPKLGVIEASVDIKLKPYLLQLKNAFKPYEIKYVMNMESEYAMRIYELCKQYQKLKVRKFELSELHDTLQVPSSYKKLFSNFKQKVLEVSKKEINKYSDIKIEFNPIKRGRSVFWIEFTIERNGDNIIETEVASAEINNSEIENFEEFKILFLKFK